MKSKNIRKFFALLIIFIIIDQIVKVVILNSFANIPTDAIDIRKYPIFGNILYFAPTINTKLTYVHALFGLQVNKMAIILMNIFIVFFFFSGYRYFLFNKEFENICVELICLFGLAGSTCALLDKLFWNGSLDFIYIEKLFICDLKDIYLFLVMSLALIFVLTNGNIIRQFNIKRFLLFSVGGKV